MIILGFDCSGGACSAAILRGGEAIAHKLVTADRGHAGLLIPLINGVLADAGCSYSDIDCYGVTVGPGSYTGIRIGLATARGMAAASAKPLIGVTTTQAVAHRIARQYPSEMTAGRAMAICLDTKRADVYLQCFADDLTEHSSPAALSVHSAVAALPDGKILVAGSSAAEIIEASGRADVVGLAGDQGLTDAIDVAAISADIVLNRKQNDMAPPHALYLRLPDVTLPAAGKSKS